MADDEQRKQRKRARNARDYIRSKAVSDHALLRLDKGAVERLDAASAAAGLSRAAFARLFLSPLVDALAPRLGSIERARSARGQSLSRFLGLAIDAALVEPVSPPVAASTAADEFDLLFGPSGGGAS